MLYLVAALSDDDVIGVDGQLPWRLKRDLKWFRMNTSHGAVIMGRKTWESLPKRPLPHRLNIVLTRGRRPRDAPNVIWENEMRNAISTAYRHTKRVYVIGGSEIFAMALQYCRAYMITRVHCRVRDQASAYDMRTFRLPACKTLVWRSGEQHEDDLSYHFELYIT